MDGFSPQRARFYPSDICSPNFQNAYFDFGHGHGHLGLIQAAVTGAMLVDLHLQRSRPLPLSRIG